MKKPIDLWQRGGLFSFLLDGYAYPAPHEIFSLSHHPALAEQTLLEKQGYAIVLLHPPDTASKTVPNSIGTGYFINSFV